jgi:hypothetical protein
LSVSEGLELRDFLVPHVNENVKRLSDLVHSVKAQGLEGLVAKRRDSRYEPGERSGAWLKMRVNRAQEFVIGGYTVGGATFDALTDSLKQPRSLHTSDSDRPARLSSCRPIGFTSGPPTDGGARLVGRH